MPGNYSAAVWNVTLSSPEMKITSCQSRETSVPELEVRYDFNTPKNLSFIVEDEAWAPFGKIKCNLLASKCSCVL